MTLENPFERWQIFSHIAWQTISSDAQLSFETSFGSNTANKTGYVGLNERRSLIQIREQKYFSAIRKTEQIHNSLLTLLQTAQTCSNLSSSTCCCSAWNFPPDSCMARSITSFKSLVKIHFLVRPLFKISIPLCMHNELHIPFFSFVVFSSAMISNIANLHI